MNELYTKVYMIKTVAKFAIMKYAYHFFKTCYKNSIKQAVYIINKQRVHKTRDIVDYKYDILKQ